MREKQINESKRLIVDGFFSLLDEKDYSKVTMSNIAEKAMVSRMTLYRYFNYHLKTNWRNPKSWIGTTSGLGHIIITQI